LTHGHLKKIKKKSRGDMWQLLFMAINYLNGVSIKKTKLNKIDEN